MWCAHRGWFFWEITTARREKCANWIKFDNRKNEFTRDDGFAVNCAQLAACCERRNACAAITSSNSNSMPLNKIIWPKSDEIFMWKMLRATTKLERKKSFEEREIDWELRRSNIRCGLLKPRWSHHRFNIFQHIRSLPPHQQFPTLPRASCFALANSVKKKATCRLSHRL